LGFAKLDDFLLSLAAIYSRQKVRENNPGHIKTEARESGAKQAAEKPAALSA
jgi:hypothetical protein